jgi:hypothetical protein
MDIRRNRDELPRSGAASPHPCSRLDASRTGRGFVLIPHLLSAAPVALPDAPPQDGRHLIPVEPSYRRSGPRKSQGGESFCIPGPAVATRPSAGRRDALVNGCRHGGVGESAGETFHGRAGCPSRRLRKHTGEPCGLSRFKGRSRSLPLLVAAPVACPGRPGPLRRDCA